MAETYFDTFIHAVGDCLDKSRILGDEYLIFPPSENYGYAATPRNSLTFGTMGVDGVHYVILKLNGEICDDSPIIQVGPMDFSEPYSLLGESLLEYFSLGCDVSMAEMQDIFDRERAGQSVLVEFLKQHFDHSRHRVRDRRDEMARFVDLIETPDEE